MWIIAGSGSGLGFDVKHVLMKVTHENNDNNHNSNSILATDNPSFVSIPTAVSSLQVGFTKEGKIIALDIDLYNNAGNTLDLSHSVMDRALLHSDNAYKIPHVRAQGHLCKTNTASNTAFRGFGGPQVLDFSPLPYIDTHPLSELRKTALSPQASTIEAVIYSFATCVPFHWCTKR